MSISPEIQKLLDEVVAGGQFETHDDALAEALRLLKVQQLESNGGQMSAEQWRAKFKAHLDSTPKSAADSVDDTRTSIYEGRGE